MGAQVSQFRAVQGQLARVGVQLEFVPVPVLEQVIARFQRPAVAEQGQSVAWMPLAAQKVHVFPAGVRAGLHQGKVVIPHPYHGIAVRQVAALVFAGLSVDAGGSGASGAHRMRRICPGSSPRMPKDCFPWETRGPVRAVRGDCRRSRKQTASSRLVFPRALFPRMMAPCCGICQEKLP